VVPKEERESLEQMGIAQVTAERQLGRHSDPQCVLSDAAPLLSRITPLRAGAGGSRAEVLSLATSLQLAKSCDIAASSKETAQGAGMCVFLA
jgi:hypothetical protein